MGRATAEKSKSIMVVSPSDCCCVVDYFNKVKGRQTIYVLAGCESTFQVKISVSNVFFFSNNKKFKLTS